MTVTTQALLTSRQAAEHLGITLHQWYYLGRTGVQRQPPRDGTLPGGRGDEPGWLASTLDAHRAEILSRLGRRTLAPERHRAVLAGTATPGLPDTAEGRAAVAADLGLHPRTVARHLAAHAAKDCPCYPLDNSLD